MTTQSHPEANSYSKFPWTSQAGGYILSVPRSDEELHITPKLEEFKLSLTAVGVDNELGIYSTLKEAFESGDEVIQRCRPSRVGELLGKAPVISTESKGSCIPALIGFTVIAIAVIVGILSPATPTTFVSSYTATQLSCRADAKQGILELNTLESKLECPTFLDAPLGIKHCAAKEEVEATKIIIQDRFDSCTK